MTQMPTFNGSHPPTSAKPLRVLQIHNFYQQRGGEDVVVHNEAALLQQAGVELHTWYVDSASLNEGQGWFKKLQLLGRLCWNFSAQRQLRTILQANPVDVIHLHNCFPLLSPAILHTAKQLGVPVVLTVHNFRWCQPSGTIQNLSDVQQRPWQLLGQRLYRQSRWATALMIAQIQLHRWLGSYQLCQKLLCPSHFVKEALLLAGFTEQQLIVKAHSVSPMLAANSATNPDTNPDKNPDKKPDTDLDTSSPEIAPALAPGYVLFVGRADAAKGLYFLLQTWQQLAYPLCIVGVTEQQAAQWLGYQPHPQVFFAGPQPQAALPRFYQQAKVLVVPSLVAETFGNVVVEAFCHGTPCLVSDLGALPELVLARHNSAIDSDAHDQAHAQNQQLSSAQATQPPSNFAGAVFKAGDSADLVQKLTNMLQQPALLAQMSQQARQQYLAHYLPAQNQQALLACYHQVLAEQGKVVGG